MRKILYFIILFPVLFFGQTQNSITSIEYKIPTTTTITSPEPEQATTVRVFYDGLGRPIQQIANKQSASSKNIVTHIEYDDYGNQIKNYLPYKSTSTSLDYIAAAKAETEAFYLNATSGSTGNPNFETTGNPYSLKELENSPLNRTKQIAAPGNDWAMPLNHTVKNEYRFNTSSDNVRLFKVATTFTSGFYEIALVNGTTSVYYDDNVLYKTITKDENWINGNNNTIEEFTDKNGNLVLRRRFGESVVNETLQMVAHDTYYVYDKFGNLTYVIPPKAEGNINTMLDGLCYQYKYDTRNRIVEKKIPGKDWEYIVYDKLDRVVATSPALYPFGGSENGWNITKYDNLNRPVYTGWFNGLPTNTWGRLNYQTTCNNATVISETRIRTPTVVGYVNVSYSKQVYPEEMVLLTINYYDDYNYLNAPTLPSTVGSETVRTNVKGLLTGTWVRILTLSTEFNGNFSYDLYDSKERVIRSYTKNYPQGYTYIDNKLDFQGKALYSITRHKRMDADNELVIREDYTYTNQGRLQKIVNKIESCATCMPELIAENLYDELGQLIVKKVGNTSAVPLQTVNYNYNIRGWLKGINNDNSGNPVRNTTEKDLFSYKLNYNNIANDAGFTGKAQYNGNISESYWITSTDDKLRKYDYKYDKLDRLTDAVYQRPGVGTTNSYNENVWYDKNGNITKLNRKGDFDSADLSIDIDLLDYIYDPNSNRLRQIIDQSGDYGGFKDDVTRTATNIDTDFDYDYDGNGNLIKDQNKKMSPAGQNPVKYNNFNLPVEITFNPNATATQKIRYIYDGRGTKLQKIIGSGTNSTTDYVNGFQYKNGVLQFFPTAEGYVNQDQGFYKYVYNYLDHLGNVRLSYAADVSSPNGLAVMEQSHYYPFGMKHKNYNVTILKFRGSNVEQTLNSNYKYRYNGKEYQDDFDLNTYDFGARHYDPAIGRWTNIDPLAEMQSSSSTYSYAYNNPVFFIDEDGRIPTPYEAAVMALHVYGGSKIQLVGNWNLSSKKTNNIDDKSSGLKASMYERVKNDGSIEYAYVYAGSVHLNDWVNNFKQVSGLSTQYGQAAQRAKKISNQFGRTELTFIGHSLGGGLSNLSSIATGRASITFNAAWISGLSSIMDVGIFKKGKINNYVNNNDPLTNIQDKAGFIFSLHDFGERHEIVGDNDGSLLENHSMEKIIERIDKKSTDGDYKNDQNKQEKGEKGYFKSYLKQMQGTSKSYDYD